LVARLGIQAIPTGFGRFVIRRDLINVNLWRNIISDTSPLFSHVIAFMHFTRNELILWEQTNILIYKQSSYHEGSDSNWKRFGEISNTPWLTPFNAGLTSQIRYLVESGIWSKHQAEFALFNERENVAYQSDYLLSQTLKQLRDAEIDPRQNLRPEDRSSLTWYFNHIAHSRLPFFRPLLEYSQNLELGKPAPRRTLDNIEKILPQNGSDGAFSGGICRWLDGAPVFGLPYGYVQIVGEVEDRIAVMRIFDLDLIQSNPSFTYFDNISSLGEKEPDSWVLFEKSLSLESSFAWNSGFQSASFVSIPKIYATPSLIFMRIFRSIPKPVRKSLRKLTAHAKLNQSS
jgi:hypothetical protein